MEKITLNRPAYFETAGTSRVKGTWTYKTGHPAMYFCWTVWTFKLLL